ncbi:MAG: hypothetical protein ABI934_12240 [Actinomycetota bacterium]
MHRPSKETAGHRNDCAEAHDAEADHGLVQIMPLTHPVLWGQEFADERCLPVASV